MFHSCSITFKILNPFLIKYYNKLFLLTANRYKK